MLFLSSSEKQTFIFAKKFSKKITGGKILGLIGNLGAGKTIFAKGLAAGFKIKKNINSPTFVLMKVYNIKFCQKQFNAINKKNNKIKFFVHIDAYRIKSARDLIAIGAHEYFNRHDAIVVIEWADKIKKILPEKTRFIKIINKNKKNRIINY